ncbi:MAG TPA: discoidin domain-containing protein, partial [Tepidisphaeraceae bacterium]|nr:discoidin domain-containing protein [Tepidisphaeraceae bacterium]
TGQLVPRSRVVGGRANQKVTNVRFEGIWIYGDQKASPVEFNLSTNAFVEGVVVTQLPAPLGTGPTVRRPVVAALATQPFENSPITNALDGNPATEFVTNRDYGYIQFDLGAVRSVTDMRVMYGGTHWHGQYRFNLAVSDDGTHFRTIQTDQLSIPIGTWQSFSLPGETRARFIRYLPKAKTTTSKFTYLREIEFYGRDMPAGPAGKLGIAWASSTPHWTIGGAGGSLYAELLESTPRAISPVHAPKLTWSFDAAAGPQRLVFDVHRVGAARSRFWWRLNDGLWVLASADQIAKAPLLVPGVVELNEGVHRVTIAHESGGIQVRGIELRPVLRRLATPWIPVVPTHTGLLPVSDPLPERHLLVVI